MIFVFLQRGSESKISFFRQLIISAFTRKRMKKNKLNDKWARIIGIPVIVALLILFNKDLSAFASVSNVLIKIIKNIIYVFVYWESNRTVFIYLRNKYPNPEQTARKIGIQLMFFIAFILVFGFIIALINHNTYNDNETFSDEYIDTVAKSAVILSIITICYECVYFFGKWKHSLYESEQLKKEGLISQFELLKNQISPHFLFNSLNALITLVPEDAQLSVLFIQKLSNVYRHVLNYNEKNVIDLKTEIEFLKDYIFLFQIRFGENLIVEYHLPEEFENIQVVPFTLQMLVENAIKHNIVSNKRPLYISIRSNGHAIIVKNNLQKKTSGIESTNTGLRNIINRYRLLTTKVVDIVVTTTEFSVSLPLIFDHTGL